MNQPAGTARELDRLAQRHRACRRCVDAGHLASARPVFAGRAGQRILLVGQAPGPVEVDTERPFAGRAGRQLMRWLVRAGFADEAEVRDRVWITSTTTCFPGRRRGGEGDRRPTPAEVALCAPWLDGVLRLLDPPLVIAVGGLALHRLVGENRRLDDVVGDVLTIDRIPPAGGDPSPHRLVVPLPHPSGQSRWLNHPARVLLLDAALERLRDLVAAASPAAAWRRPVPADPPAPAGVIV